MNTTIAIKRALISVYDKSNLLEIALFLRSLDVLIMSTGKTAQFLKEKGLVVTDISAIGKFPEILDGRVKTLNPRIYAGILYDRAKDSHCSTVSELDIPPIDLVVCNLYPFLEISLNPHVSTEELIENIDIGGPAMLRAAAKNYSYVTVLHHPKQYEEFINHCSENNGVTLAFREQCAKNAFAFTSMYDQKIAESFAKKFAHHSISYIDLEHKKSLRYGENPHQNAQVYGTSINNGEISLPSISSLSGKELSYNNLLDTHAAIFALRCLFDQKPHQLCSAVIVKHQVPCGAAEAKDSMGAIKKAIASDEKSAFGGILALSFPCDELCIEMLKERFFEVIIAPSFSKKAIDELTKKKNLRLLPIDNLMTARLDSTSYRSIFGGMLYQDHDVTDIDINTWTTVTQKIPSTIDLKALNFACRIVKATPSNAIAIANAEQLLGIGAGQPNRIQSAEIAIFGAKSRGFDISSSAMASDGFFPFEDCICLAHKHGIRLVIQPGGALRDQEIIAYANQLGISMIFTHKRCFRH